MLSWAEVCTQGGEQLVTELVLAVALSGGGLAVCHEDESCWNWRTMGNHQRGVTLKPEAVGGGVAVAKHVVVGPRRFDRLVARKRIDWKITPHLLGDRR